jgi:hypothetical protein
VFVRGRSPLRSELRDPRTEDLDRVAPLNDGDRAGRPAGHRDQPRKRPSELRVGRALRRPAERHESAGDDLSVTAIAIRRRATGAPSLPAGRKPVNRASTPSGERGAGREQFGRPELPVLETQQNKSLEEAVSGPTLKLRYSPMELRCRGKLGLTAPSNSRAFHRCMRLAKKRTRRVCFCGLLI